jgi:hypothetical protein
VTEETTMNPELREVLLKAFGPCPAFTGACSEMRWDPAKGHVPRGYCGATGELEEVGLVLVCAEPGDPHFDERYDEGNAASQMRRAYLHAYKSYKGGTDLFHRNIRFILDLCWPGISFDQQLRRTWLVDSVLCSARAEGAKVSGVVEHECRRRYLERQLALMPRAVVVALGGKAFSRLSGIPQVLKAHSAAPPGCNYKPARPSWVEVARQVQSRITR